jgi:hypothetical protein
MADPIVLQPYRTVKQKPRFGACARSVPSHRKREDTNMGETYKPGEKVPSSGIYKVVHDKGHAQEHEVTCVLGEPFPPCNGCGHGVRFTLVRAAHHVKNHEHFK